RCGPHCISTPGPTPEVPRPTSRLRAERCTSEGSGAVWAWSRANAASAAPSMTLAVGRVGAHRKGARVDPPAHGVVADAQQACGVGDPELRHSGDLRSAIASLTSWGAGC